jgi:ketosteroid isomerase-like protein
MAATTETVLKHHVQAAMSRNIDATIQDFTEDSILFTPTETYKGLDRIKAGFTAIWKTFKPEMAANLKLIKQEINDEYAYFLISALPAIPFMGEMYHIRNGKILMQSVFVQAGI